MFSKISLSLLLSDFLSFFLSIFLSFLGLIYYGDYQNRWLDLLTWWKTVGIGHFTLFFVFVILSLIRFSSRGHYTTRRPFWDELLLIIQTLFFFSAVHGITVLAAKWPISRFMWLIAWGSSIFILPLFRYLTRMQLQRWGLWKKNICILGCGKNALEAMESLMSEKSLGYNILCFFCLPSPINSKPSLPTNSSAPTFNALPEVSQFLPFQGASVRNFYKVEMLDEPESIALKMKEKGSNQLIVALESEELDQYPHLLQQLSLGFFQIFWVPPLQGLPLLGMEAQHFFTHEVLMLKIRNNLDSWGNRFLKRGFDILSSILILLLLSPFLILLSIWVRYGSCKTPIPILFKHKRIGKHGKLFYCYKFQTMVPNAQDLLKDLLEKDPEARSQWEKEFKLKNDPRITSIGHFLRKTSIDELPQLFNVLKGEMSLVGPRPVTEHEVLKYGHQSIFYLASRPGITGLWQVSGRNDIGYNQRVSLDAWYVKNWTIWYDIVILFKTISVVLRRKGAY